MPPLISAQSAVLEHNVSPQVAAQYKRASMAGISALGGLMLRSVTELGEPDAVRLDFTATVREVLQVMIAGLLARSSR